MNGGVEIGPDGVLTFPLGQDHANQVVRVVIEPVDEAADLEKRRRFVEETAGQWQGEFVREEREPLG